MDTTYQRMTPCQRETSRKKITTKHIQRTDNYNEVSHLRRCDIDLFGGYKGVVPTGLLNAFILIGVLIFEKKILAGGLCLPTPACGIPSEEGNFLKLYIKSRSIDFYDFAILYF